MNEGVLLSCGLAEGDSMSSVIESPSGDGGRPRALWMQRHSFNEGDGSDFLPHRRYASVRTGAASPESRR